eukprot:9489251-Pyramimonas_sp.AAC.1
MPDPRIFPGGAIQSTRMVRMGSLPKGTLASLPLRPILSDLRWPTSLDKRQPGPLKPLHPYRASL